MNLSSPAGKALPEVGDCLVKAAGHDLQHRVADAAAEAVVEDVEVVEIDQHQASRPLPAPSGLEGTGDDRDGQVGLVDRCSRKGTL